MASRTLFSNKRPAPKPAPIITANEAGGLAYKLDPRHALAQLSCTGALSTTFYVSADTQLDTILSLCAEIQDPVYVAKTAVYARQHGFMKDTPALLLCALVSPQAVPWESQTRANLAFERAFPIVADNGRLIRNVVQILRSGKLGRRSLGTLPRRAIANWLNSSTDWQLWNASVGDNPSLRDVIRMVRPDPLNEARAAVYNYLTSSKKDPRAPLNPQMRAYRQRVAGDTNILPDAPFELMLGLPNLSKDDWLAIARKATWQQTRANLNTFARHGVFDDPTATDAIVRKLVDPNLIARARLLPYQLLAAAATTVDTPNIPRSITEALYQATMIATQNVPAIEGNVVIAPDISGSMQSPITGQRGSATTKVQCVDVVALITYAILHRNPRAIVLPFTDMVHFDRSVSPQHTLLQLAESFHGPGRGTAVSAPLTHINANNLPVDVVFVISDQESWKETYDQSPTGLSEGLRFVDLAGSTETMRQWEILRARNPRARMICLDLQPYATVQAPERERGDILHLGGFSDSVWLVIDRFLSGKATAWVDDIESIDLGI